MNMLKNRLNNIQLINSQTMHYFKNSEQEIARKNLSSLKIISISCLIAGVFFLYILYQLTGEWSVYYTPFEPTFFAFMIFSLIYEKCKTPSYYLVQQVCFAFIIIVFCEFIPACIFPHPEYAETFIGSLIIMIPMLFVFQPWLIFIVIITAACVFLELVIMFKTPMSITHDVFATTVSVVLSILAMYISNNLRLCDFASRELYKKLSNTDLLTGLMNKLSYESSCQRLIEERSEGTACALFVLDIDNFKCINDTHGHIMGDSVLKIVGNVLLGSIRKQDLAGRIGGDEFSICLFVDGPINSIEKKAEQLLTDMREKLRSDFDVEVTVSIGVAVLEHGHMNYYALYKIADDALYAVKRASRDNIKICLAA